MTQVWSMKPFNMFSFFTADGALEHLTVPYYSFVPEVTSEVRLKSVLGALSLSKSPALNENETVAGGIRIE